MRSPRARSSSPATTPPTSRRRPSSSTAGCLPPTSRPSELEADVEKAVAESAAELVPGQDLGARLGAQRLGVEADRDRVRIVPVVVDPRFEVRERDLGVELDPPRALADAVGLHADAAAGEHRRI